jgi:ribosomal protein L11 methyltransferase
MAPEADVVVHWRVPADQSELAALALWDHGATALTGEDGPDSTILLVASYPTAEAAVSVAASLGATTERVDRSWEDAWRAYAAPVEIGEDILVVPAWHDVPVPVAGSRLVLEIDSGPCFGSGTHASTRLILQLLAATPLAGGSVVTTAPLAGDSVVNAAPLAGDSVVNAAPLAGASVLDAGTGSGILAVAAARLGAAHVTAVDVDPAAVAVTAANATRNGVADLIDASTTPVDALSDPVDLALVNVTAAVHALLGPHVTRLVRPGGTIYLAGLLPGQWPHVVGAYAGCEVLDTPELDGWVGAVLRRG